MIDRIMKVGMLKQALHKEIVSLSMGLILPLAVEHFSYLELWMKS